MHIGQTRRPVKCAQEHCFLTCRTQRLQDLQLLNLRYHGTSFLCVPIVGSDEAGASTGSERPAADTADTADTPAADSERELRLGAASTDSAKAAAATSALGCLTLGFAHDVRRHLPRCECVACDRLRQQDSVWPPTIHDLHALERLLILPYCAQPCCMLSWVR